MLSCRQMMEESTAVQCPSVAYQLAGAKKVQQDIASPEILERFLESHEDIELARSCFAGSANFTARMIEFSVHQLCLSISSSFLISQG